MAVEEARRPPFDGYEVLLELTEAAEAADACGIYRAIQTPVIADGLAKEAENFLG